MTVYTMPITETESVDVYVTPGTQGIHAWAEITATHDDGESESYGRKREIHYIDYCLAEVVAQAAIDVVSNYPRLSDDWNVWESLPDTLPECECE